MTREDFIRNHWNYYLSLENRVLHTSSYVAIDPDNDKTFSNEYAILMQAIGGEFDSFFKEYCGFNSDDKKTIAEYANYVLNDYPDIKTQSITVLGTEMNLNPFKDWDVSQAKQFLFWWIAYDDIKHSRYVNKKLACQKNVLNLLGALFLMEMKYLRKITNGQNQPDVPDKSSELFSLTGWTFHYVLLNGGFAVIDGNLDADFGDAGE